ncbi:hypothetical protein SAMN05216231_2181 [Virgibacillus salinus]|uniref:Uncharacterized protein n=1 Tax=Virgibacillus salinus TaxID=553311 RepID=A0A1H1CCE9_9BACI|nr:hypothetical protein SAMN05216231_2181 [Virgibacillus salinus]
MAEFLVVISNKKVFLLTKKASNLMDAFKLLTNVRLF